MEGWKRITNDPYVLSIVAKGYRLHFTSPPLLHETPWEIRSPQGTRRNSGNARTNIPHAPEECGNRGASEFPRILLKHIPGKQSFRRVASSHRFKKSEHSHLGTSLSYVHYRLSSEYRAKRRLRVQNRPAGRVLSRTDSSKQQEVPQICLRKQGLPVSGTPFGLNTAPQVLLVCAHGGRLPPSSGDLDRPDT